MLDDRNIGCIHKNSRLNFLQVTDHDVVNEGEYISES